MQSDFMGTELTHSLENVLLWGTNMQLLFLLLKIYPLNPILSVKNLTLAFNEEWCIRYAHRSAVSEHLKKQLSGISEILIPREMEARKLIAIWAYSLLQAMYF